MEGKQEKFDNYLMNMLREHDKQANEYNVKFAEIETLVEQKFNAIDEKIDQMHIDLKEHITNQNKGV